MRVSLIKLSLMFFVSLLMHCQQLLALPAKPSDVKFKLVDQLSFEQKSRDGKANLGSVLKRNDAKGLEAIHVVGKVKTTLKDNKKIAQVVWYKLSTSQGGMQKSAEIKKPLTSAFLTRLPELERGADIKAKGDIESLLKDARMLLNSEGEPKGLPKSSNSKNTSTSTITQETQKGRGSSKPLASSTLSSSNSRPLAQDRHREGWGNGQPQMPLSNASPAPAPSSTPIPHRPETTVEVSTEGCTPRVDEQQGQVIIQSRTIVKEDGRIKSQGQCTDSETRFPIKKDYNCAQCRDVIEDNVAFATYKNYWVNEKAEHVYLEPQGQPIPDKTTPYTIQEDFSVCQPSVDVANKVVRLQAESYYVGRTNQRTKISGCKSSETTPAIPLTYNPIGCKPVHDFDQNHSFEQMRAVYLLEGAEKEAISCHQVGNPLPHTFINDVCKPIITYDNKMTLLAKRQIELSTGKTFISGCEPLPGQHDLLATQEGCEGQYVHNIGTGQSFPKQRWYYETPQGREFVTACKKSTRSFPHQMEVKGYEHNDEKRISKAITALYILPPEGRVEVAAAEVRDHKAELPYILKEQTERYNEEKKFFSGCYELIPMEKLAVYERADGTQTTLIVGEGEAKKSGNLCIKGVEREPYLYTVFEVARVDNVLVSASDQKYGKLSIEGNHLNGESCKSFMKKYTPTASIQADFILEFYNPDRRRSILTYPDGTIEKFNWVYHNPKKFKAGLCKCKKNLIPTLNGNPQDNILCVLDQEKEVTTVVDSKQGTLE